MPGEEHQPIEEAGLTCTSCGYDLSGSAVGGSCPECGSPVRDSILRAQVQTNAPSATPCLVIGIVSLVVCQPIGPVALWMFHRTKREMDTGLYAASSMSLAKAGFWTGLVSTVLLGLWLLFVEAGMMMQ